MSSARNTCTMYLQVTALPTTSPALRFHLNFREPHELPDRLIIHLIRQPYVKRVGRLSRHRIFIDIRSATELIQATSELRLLLKSWHEEECGYRGELRDLTLVSIYRDRITESFIPDPKSLRYQLGTVRAKLAAIDPLSKERRELELQEIALVSQLI